MSTSNLSGLAVLLAVTAAGCSTLPEPVVTTYKFPKKYAFGDKPDKPYRVLGRVRTKVTFNTLNPTVSEAQLCANYFNKGVIDLSRQAIANGADAIAEVRTVTFLIDGRTETHKTAECSDDGQEGEVLLQAVAVKFDPKGIIPGTEPPPPPPKKSAVVEEKPDASKGVWSAPLIEKAQQEQQNAQPASSPRPAS